MAAGACGLDPARIARDVAVEFHAAPSPDNQASLLFDGRKTSVAGAAFAAATQIDNLDGHDGYNPTKGHIGCAVVPALIAFAEAHRDPVGKAHDELRDMRTALEAQLVDQAEKLIGILVAGRLFAGWRGKRAVYLYLWGFAFLCVAYFGARYVLEELLNRSWS